MTNRTQTDGGAATRERILETAAALFARRGFHGTTTREIAAKVGIRQPSLFHHFPSKLAILAELLNRDLRPALERIRRHRSDDADPAVCLYAYLLEDVAALVAWPFDARGMYNDEVLLEEELADQRRLRTELHEETLGMVTDGIRSGAFRSVDPLFAQQAIIGMLLDTIWVTGTHLAEDLRERPQETADFVLRGLLRHTEALDGVRAGAAALRASDAETVEGPAVR